MKVSFHADLFRQSRDLSSDVDMHAIESVVPVTETTIRDAGLILLCWYIFEMLVYRRVMKIWTDKVWQAFFFHHTGGSLVINLYQYMVMQ